MTTVFTDKQALDLHQRYMGGESSVDIARAVGCHSSTLRKRWQRMGLPVRDGSESMTLRMGKTDAAARSAITQAANVAARGRTAGFDELCKRATTIEARTRAMPATEQAVFDVLSELGTVTRQKAVGPYNTDFAINDAVAVEVFGGGWHSDNRHRARHQSRVKYLLDAGFDVVVLWLDLRYKSTWAATLHHLVSSLQHSRLDPSAPRQYRVIWSNGEIVYSGTANDDSHPDKPAFEMGRDAEGRYYRITD